MGVEQIIALTVLGFFLVILFIRIFSKPLRFILKLLLNTALGFLALFLFHYLSPLLGVHIGLNLANALIVGILGVPGFFLLLLLSWIL